MPRAQKKPYGESANADKVFRRVRDVLRSWAEERVQRVAGRAPSGETIPPSEADLIATTEPFTRFGVASNTIANWGRAGRSTIGVAGLSATAELTRVSLDWLVAGDAFPRTRAESLKNHTDVEDAARAFAASVLTDAGKHYQAKRLHADGELAALLLDGAQFREVQQAISEREHRQAAISGLDRMLARSDWRRKPTTDTLTQWRVLRDVLAAGRTPAPLALDKWFACVAGVLVGAWLEYDVHRNLGRHSSESRGLPPDDDAHTLDVLKIIPNATEETARRKAEALSFDETDLANDKRLRWIVEVTTPSRRELLETVLRQAPFFTQWL